MEEKTRLLLKKYNVPFVEQKTFEWLKYKKSLRVDFYLPDYNIAIECQGRQHFTSIDHFGGIDGFNTRKEIDYKKHSLCQENGISILYLTNTKECIRECHTSHC